MGRVTVEQTRLTLVSFAAVFRLVTQHSSPEECCVTSLKTAAKEIRVCLHEGGGPQVGEVTCGKLLHLTCKRDHIKMRDFMDTCLGSPTSI